MEGWPVLLVVSMYHFLFCQENNNVLWDNILYMMLCFALEDVVALSLPVGPLNTHSRLELLP